ncbi:hypothetical protein EMCRGX_G018983 [Ephydatia muelleri]
MAAVTIPGQPRRWGNESSNFYHASKTQTPGIPSKQKVYRCDGHQYANAGHYHIGTKTVNLDQPLEMFGTPAAYKLRSDDQRLPDPLCCSEIHTKRLPQIPVNLYQSHEQKYQLHAMPGSTDSKVSSIGKSFYVTSYQSDISKIAETRVRSAKQPSEKDPDPCWSRDSKCSEQVPVRRLRAPSAPLSRPAPDQPRLERRLSFSTLPRRQPSKGEIIKSIFSTFPDPQPHAASKKQSRPSSAVNIRTGQIPSLRKSKEWTH